ncbi:MAG TPA: hypothetical protein DEQ43_10495, partial [Nocardioides bacterium]|nr:hypothetical protein [Nocardioides sp.]
GGRGGGGGRGGRGGGRGGGGRRPRPPPAPARRDTGRTPTTYRLDDPVYWGGPIRDERYLVVA